MLLHAFVPASRANGPGLRAVVYFQGCSLNCEDCWNPTSHKFKGADLAAASIVEQIETARRVLRLEGVTFSGGEPMQQVHALVEIMSRIRVALPSASMGMFTGYTEAELDDGKYVTRPSTATAEKRKLWHIVRAHLDFAVVGRYDRTQPGTAPLRTSRNQKLLLFSSRYREGDFTEQFVEVGIDQYGKAVVTGFPVFGSPAL
ncbi:MAG TPA: 4Fe-4S single cluster domain-containing protein [Bryobacteraceae bacterium]|nr:4Fe-4S single cluster domain-containing protein [Bryobacteraceae bacterium]